MAIAAGLSTAGQWTGKYPFAKIAGGKPLWVQPGVEGRCARPWANASWRSRYKISLQEIHGPEGPVASDGKGRFAAWPCKAQDCGGNRMSVFFDSAAGNARGCWESSGAGGEAQDLWRANGKARALPTNACGYGENDPFAAPKKFGGAR